MLRRVLFLLPVAVLCADEAAAQPARAERVGRFLLEVRRDPISDEDRSWAAVPESSHPSTHLTWACGGPFLTIYLAPSHPLAGPTLTWRFDADEPVTAPVQTVPHPPDEDPITRLAFTEQHAFTARARTASRLVIRQRMGTGHRDLHFDLTGSSRALSRLQCVQSLRPPMPAPPPNPALRDDPSADVEMADQLPRLLNQEDVMRMMHSVFPPDLLWEGGTVTVSLRVRADGTVDAERSRVVRMSDSRLQDVARRVIPIFRFHPARHGGRPVSTRLEIPLVFNPVR